VEEKENGSWLLYRRTRMAVYAVKEAHIHADIHTYIYVHIYMHI
jgi:hypothetical protein